MAEPGLTLEEGPRLYAAVDEKKFGGAEMEPVSSESSNADVAVGDTRRIPGPIPWMLFLICVVEFSERFAYLGINGPLQNYIQNPYPHDEAGIPGALNGGQMMGTALGDVLKFWSYLCTVFGAVIADQYLGKFKTIMVASPIYIAGMVILVATSAPAAIESGAALGGLIASIIFFGFGTGTLKACIAPLCGEQNPEKESKEVVLKTGEKVIVDPELTTARIFMWYYWAANIGGLSTLITTTAEKEVGFWLAYLIPLLMFLVVLAIFFGFHKKINKVPAQGSPLTAAWKTVKIAAKEGSLDRAKPSHLQAQGRLDRHMFAQTSNYTDGYVDQVKRGVKACKYFVLFPIFFLCWTQIFNNLISQAGSMKLDGTTNDLMQTLQTIFMLAFIPILDLLVYPCLRKFDINISPVLRVGMGFFVTGLGMVYACVLQYYIYENPPYSLDVWIQTPAYVLGALGEIWVVVTGLELAFTKAPENLRTVVASVFWVTVALGSALGIALSPVSRDPLMVWTYGALGIAATVAGLIFMFWFRREVTVR